MMLSDWTVSGLHTPYQPLWWDQLMLYYLLDFAGSCRVKVGYRGGSSNWHNFLVQEPIEMKQSLNTKWSKPQHINEKRIQIGEAISETEFYCVHKAPYNSFFLYIFHVQTENSYDFIIYTLIKAWVLFNTSVRLSFDTFLNFFNFLIDFKKVIFIT